MNPLKKIAGNFLKKKSDENGTDDSVPKILNKKAKIMKYGIIGGVAFFFVAIIAILGVVSSFLGFVQSMVEDVGSFVQDATKDISTSLQAGCIFCSEKDIEKLKEEQFKSKIQIVKETFGNQVDEVVLASTVLFQGDYYDVLDAQYDVNYNESEYRDFWSEMKEGIRNFTLNDEDGYKGITTEEINLIDAATIVMVNSNVNGSYNEESYKKALASTGFVVDDPAKNAQICFTEQTKSVLDTIWDANPFVKAYNLISQGTSDTVADNTLRIANTADICANGFIGGTFNDIRKMKDGPDKDRKKQDIAKNIVEFAKFYRELFPENNQCLYSGSVGSGDMVNWRQCGAPWSNLTLGGTSSVCRIGCTATSMSYLITKSGTKLSVSSFDPSVFVKNADFTGGALIWNSWNNIAPNFSMIEKNVPVNNRNAADVLSKAISQPCGNNNQPYIVLFLSLGHWVAFDHVENGEVYVMDPSAKAGAGLVPLSQAWKGKSLDSYNKFCAYDVPFGSSGSSNSSSGSSSKILDVKSDAYKKRLENSKKYYQCSSDVGDKTIVKDSSMCRAGCIISSLMGIQYMYTGMDIDVGRFIGDVVSQGAWIYPGGGLPTPYFDSPENSPKITQNWGLSARAIKPDIKSIKASLKNGKKILFNITDNNGVYATRSGHFVMFDHIDPDTGQIYVWDPVGTKDRNGYKSDDEIEKQLLNVMASRGPWEVSSNRANSDDMCETSSGVGEITIPTEFGNGGFTVTEYDIFNWAYNQGKVYKKWANAGGVFDNGIATYQGRYLIACTETFGKVGDKVDFFLEDGTKIPAIIADIKSSGDAGYNKWGHNNGQNVLEFEVSTVAFRITYRSNPGTNGWFQNEWGGKRVASATNLGETIID